MKIEKLLLFVTFCALCGFVNGGLPTTPEDVSFEKYYVPNWNLDHIKYINGGSEVQLLLDKNSGSGFESKGSYLFGYFSMRLKLVGGDSAGVVTAFYLCSELPDHDEIDFEFLGNRTGRPYIVQTNVFARGKGEKEQRIYLWFDPTEEYHSYSVLWNKYQIVFYVDHVPIRVFKNSKDIGVNFPLNKPMKVYSTLWEADDWVTRGGLEKIDWSKAPFVASYSSFYINGTDVSTMKSAGHQLTRGEMWWDQPEFQDLDTAQYKQLSLVRQKLTVYNYCTDKPRNPTVPPECVTDKDV